MRPRVSSDFGPALCIPIVRSSTASWSRHLPKPASQFPITHKPRNARTVFRKGCVRLAGQWRQKWACQLLGPMPVMAERIQAHDPGMVAQPNRALVADNCQLLGRAGGGQARKQPGSVRRLRWNRIQRNQRRLRRKPVCKAPAEPAFRIVEDEQASHVRLEALQTCRGETAAARSASARVFSSGKKRTDWKNA